VYLVCVCVYVFSGGCESAFVNKRDCDCECKCERECVCVCVCVCVSAYVYNMCMRQREQERERARKSEKDFHRRGLTLCSPDIYSFM